MMDEDYGYIDESFLTTKCPNCGYPADSTDTHCFGCGEEL